VSELNYLIDYKLRHNLTILADKKLIKNRAEAANGKLVHSHLPLNTTDVLEMKKNFRKFFHFSGF
jgi:hypothetical protein